MKIAFIRVHKHPTKHPGGSSAKESSSSKTIIADLERRGIARGCEEWRLSPAPSNGDESGSLLSSRSFAVDEEGRSPEVERYITTQPTPDVLWIEGSGHPLYLRQVFELCARSLKIVYSKDWKPQKIEGLASYDLCLVDEDWQVEKLRGQGVRAAVWDKLIDYETTHRPIDCEKRYDICYVAYLRRRKQHELLFRSMAKLPERSLRCVCVGGDPDGRLSELQELAGELGIAADFVGEVSKDEVNRYVNQSRIGVICARDDAAPRALLEYMAANLPVLVNSELLAGARYVGAQAGLIRQPDGFAEGIAELLDHIGEYAPRAYLLDHFSRERVIEKFVDILRDASAAAGKELSLPALSASGSA